MAKKDMAKLPAPAWHADYFTKESGWASDGGEEVTPQAPQTPSSDSTSGGPGRA